MSKAVASDGVIRTYGYLALLLGIFLCWYAAWTVACTVLVLTGIHYAVLLWVPALPTLITAAAAWRYGRGIIDRYSIVATRAPVPQAPVGQPYKLAWIAAALVVALVTSQLSQRFESVAAVVLGAALTAFLLYRAVPRGFDAPFAPPLPAFGWRPVALLVFIYALYLFGHRADGDDANFVNLAIGAKRTAGYVYQFDTMIGDGPNLIHLPTYKFHTFELLGAILSSYSGIEPVYVFHFLLPLMLIPFLVAVLAVTFGPTAGPRWLPAAILWTAILFFNLSSIGGWGLHGVVRLFQGKGFYVSALLPLIAVMTVRWFQRGERSDLVGLLLANVCAVGFTANGIYGGPVASVMAALPLVLTRAADPTIWRRLVALAPTIVWPAVAVVCILVFGLAYPSEVLTVMTPPKELNFDTWYGVSGRLFLVALLISGIGLAHAGFGRKAAFLYVPLFLLVTMNPIGWAVVVKLTGNLGFRIFWSLLAPVSIALLGVAVLDAVRLRSEQVQIALSLAIVAASVVVVSYNEIIFQRIYWHRPTLRVDQVDWADTLNVSSAVNPNCSILLPERYSVLLSMKEYAARPVAVRALYMVHYRFTLPQPERKLRANLLLLADGTLRHPTMDAEAIRANHIAIGAIAVRQDAPTIGYVAKLASSLGLVDRGMRGPLRLWASGCYVPSSAGAAR